MSRSIQLPQKYTRLFNIQRTFLPIMLLVYLFFRFATPVSAVSCTSNATGNWNVAATWTGCTGGNGTTANTPGPDDTATITGTHTVTVTANETVWAVIFGSASTNGVVSVNAGVTLSVTSNSTYNVQLFHNASANTAGTFTGNGTITAGGIFVGNDVAFGSGTYTATFTSTISTLNITDNALALNSYVGNTASRIGNSTFNHSSGTINLQQILTTNENAANTSTFTMANGAQSGILNISNTTPFSLSGTGTNTITLNGTSAVVNYNGAAAQTIRGTNYTTLKLITLMLQALLWVQLLLPLP
jgi:hypothetical protein